MNWLRHKAESKKEMGALAQGHPVRDDMDLGFLSTAPPAPPPLVCRGCGCLVDPSRAKILMLTASNTNNLSFDHFCEACMPPYDEAHCRVIFEQHYFNHIDGVRTEVTIDGKVKRARKPAKRRRR